MAQSAKIAVFWNRMTCSFIHRWGTNISEEHPASTFRIHLVDHYLQFQKYLIPMWEKCVYTGKGFC
jgi:hypothetical protein